MEERVEKAIDLFKKKYNCAQAVACAYSDLFGVEEQTAFRMAEGFGGGIGGTHKGTCGAVSAMYLLAGLKCSGGSVENGVTKMQTYEKVRALADKFAEKNGSVICEDLLGQGKAGVKHSCIACIEDAARFAQELLLND